MLARGIVGSAALAAALFAPRAWAQPMAGSEKVDTQQAPTPSGITGDWGGTRTHLADIGVQAAASYVSETAWNFEGGERGLVRESGQFALSFTGDMSRLAGFHDAIVQATITERRGDDLGAAAGLNVLQQVQEVYGRGQTARLTQFWYEQLFADGAVAIKLGRATVGEDFDSFSCYFMNLSFCGSPPGNIAGSYWYNWPISQWTARLRLNQGADYFQTAIYEINPRNLDNAFSFGRFHGATGILVPAEVGWSTSLGQGRLVGFFKIGGWYSTAPGNDLLLDINHQPRVITGAAPLLRTSRYGIWIAAQQQLLGTAIAGKPMSGIGVFLNATFSDKRTSSADSQIAAGLYWKAVIPSLPDDVLGLGIARTHVSTSMAQSEALDPSGPAIQHSEYAAEIYYSFHAFNWLELRPNFQLVRHPGGYQGERDVGIAGLKAGVTL